MLPDTMFVVQLTVGDLRQIIRQVIREEAEPQPVATGGTVEWNKTEDGVIHTPFGPIYPGGPLNDSGKEATTVTASTPEALTPDYITASMVFSSSISWEELMKVFAFTKEQALQDINEGRLETRYSKR